MPEHNHIDITLVCKQKKCGRSFEIDFAAAVRERQLTCPHCKKKSYYTTADFAPALKEAEARAKARQVK